MFIHEQTYTDLINELEQLRRTTELSGQINANLRSALATAEDRAYCAERNLDGERARAARAERNLEDARAREESLSERIAGELYETCRQLDAAVDRAKQLKRELRRERRLFEALRDDYHTLYYRARDEAGERETWKACAEEREKELADVKAELAELGGELAESYETICQQKKMVAETNTSLRKAKADLDAARAVHDAEEKEWGGNPKLNGIGWVDLRCMDGRKLSGAEKALITAELRRKYEGKVFHVGKTLEVSVRGHNHLWLEVTSIGGLSPSGTNWTHTRLRDDVFMTIN